MAYKSTRSPITPRTQIGSVEAKQLIAAPGTPLIPWKVRIGPYLFSVKWADRTTMQSKRLLAEVCPNRQEIRLSKKLSGIVLARYFLRSVIGQILYAAGLSSKSIAEEQATQLTATCLVALIAHNSEVLTWFDALITSGLKPDRHTEVIPDAVPATVCIGRSRYAIEPMSRKSAKSLNQWGNIDLETRTMQLSEELRDTHLSVIFLHELLHGIHKEGGLRGTANRDTAYVRVQADGIVGFIRKNLIAWRWFVYVTHNAAAKQTVGAAGHPSLLRLAA